MSKFNQETASAMLRSCHTSILFFFFPFFFTINGSAQEGAGTKEAVQITSFNFKQLPGGVILLRAQFSDFADSLSFILDTGSGGISLDSSTIEKFNIKSIASEQTIIGIGGLRKVSFVYNEKLKLGELVIDSLNFHISDYGILSAVYGEKIDGIIGYSILSRYIFQINYDSSIIRVYSNGKIKYPRGGWMYNPLLFRLPVQEATIVDAETFSSKFLFDIGAGLPILLNKEFIENSSFLKKNRKVFAHAAIAVGGVVDMQMTVIRKLQIGPYKFRSVPILIFNDEFKITSYPYLTGIIGNDILRRFNIFLNYANREFYLTPNSHFNDFFNYAYSGAELYFLDNKIMVSDVAKKSPAALAGLKEDDIVIGINKYINLNLNQSKEALQTIGEKIKMIVYRNGELLRVEFKIKSIL